MAVWVICNVGTRDVRLDGQEIRPARPRGEAILRDLERDPTLAGRLSFEIIEPCLRELLRLHPTGLDRVILLGTDQPDPAHRETDTLYFAEILRRCLGARLEGLRAMEVRLIRGINPALYDEAYEAMDRLLAELGPAEGETVCYIILAGGTPACNAALLLQGVRHWGDRVQAVYMPEGRSPLLLRVGRQVVSAFREEAAVDRLRSRDFAGALRHLERLEAHPGLIALVDYAARRLEFDFRAARRALHRALEVGDRRIREFIGERPRLREDLELLLEGGEGGARLRALLRELFWNARAAWENRRYADFLGRVYRLQEATLRLLVEEIFGLSTDLAPDVREENQRRWEAYIEANPSLRAFLERQQVEGQPLDWRVIARPVYKAMLAYASEGGADAEGRPLLPEDRRRFYKALIQRANQLDGLVELRHRTIIGHDFQGVSEEDLRARYRPRASDGREMDPAEGLAEIMRMLGMDLREDPYAAIAAFAEDYLRGRASPGAGDGHADAHPR